jgi:CubicO group peptidase (beta-lactamase class C family)/predicted glycoside hydrolase/deacetylase ChbG (UPF0249 family)
MKKILFLLLFSSQIFAQKTLNLPRSTPEAEGVSSAGITQFLDEANKGKDEFHSFMILRHGKVISEGWWNPFRSDLSHTMYSTSKSFTATAIGFLVAENKLTVNDKVVSFFPESVPENSNTSNPLLAELRIKDLLSMSVGHEKENSPIMITEDWVKEFLKTPIKYQPGSKFLYNSPATYMLSAIVQKVSGQKLIDFLQPRLFEPLGIKNIDWEVDPKGINTGGWGLRLKTEDMAKFGQLFLQKGRWNGKQILPESWVAEASKMQILQSPDMPQAKRDSSDWQQGYGYQMWRCRNNGFRADGAFGQYIIVLPEQDAVIAITAEAVNMQSEINLVWKYLLPAFMPKKLRTDAVSRQNLQTKITALAIPTAIKNSIEAKEKAISGKTFAVYSKNKSFKSISFDFKDEKAQMTLTTDSATHQIPFGAGTWALGQTTKLGPYLVARAMANRKGLPIYKTAGSYTWKDDKTLELTLKYIESPHVETILCVFDGDNVSISMLDMFNKNLKIPASKAVLQSNVVNPTKLIIRGDDMGFSHSGNLALIKSFQEGIETSIEVIVPSPWFPEAVKMLKDNPKVDVGLHFAITAEWDNIKWRPLTAAPSLRNADGYFYPMLFHNNNYNGQAVLDNPWKIADVEAELRAQIEMALKYIPRLSHVSGHMGATGFSPEIKAMVKRVGQEYKLKMVDAEPKELDLNYTWFDLKNKNTEQRIEAFIAMIDKLEEGKNYVFVEHPGLDDAELRAISHIGYEDVAQGRQDVTTIFTSEKVKAAILKKGIQLVSYKEFLGN